MNPLHNLNRKLNLEPVEGKSKEINLINLPVDIFKSIFQFLSLCDQLKTAFLCKETKRKFETSNFISIRTKIEIEKKHRENLTMEALKFIQENLYKVSGGTSEKSRILKGDVWFNDKGEIRVLAGIESRSIVTNMEKDRQLSGLAGFRVTEKIGIADLRIQVLTKAKPETFSKEKVLRNVQGLEIKKIIIGRVAEKFFASQGGNLMIIRHEDGYFCVDKCANAFKEHALRFLIDKK